MLSMLIAIVIKKCSWNFWSNVKCAFCEGNIRCRPEGAHGRDHIQPEQTDKFAETGLFLLKLFED